MRKLISVMLVFALSLGLAAALAEQDNFLVSDWKLLYAMFERAEKWSIHAGAGHYPDADMLPIGPIKQDYDKKNKNIYFVHIPCKD